MKNIKSKKYDTSLLLLAVFIMSIPVFMYSYVTIVDTLTGVTSELIHSFYSILHTILHK